MKERNSTNLPRRCLSHFYANEKTVQPMPYGRGFHGGSRKSNPRPACVCNGLRPPTHFARCCPFCRAKQAWGKKASSVGGAAPSRRHLLMPVTPGAVVRISPISNIHSLKTICFDWERCSLPIPSLDSSSTPKYYDKKQKRRPLGRRIVFSWWR